MKTLPVMRGFSVLRRNAGILLVIALGVALSGLVFVVIRSWELRGLQNDVRKIAQERVELLNSHIMRSTEVLHEIASFYSASGAVSRVQFEIFTRSAILRQPELQALEWVPRVPAALRQEYEAAVRAEHPLFQFTETKDDTTIVSESSRDEYFPVYFVEPLAGNEAAFGLDLRSDATRKSALEKARDTGTQVATPAIRLAQEVGTQLGFLVFHPLYRAAQNGGIAERRESLAGFAVAVFRIGNLVEPSLKAH